MARKRTDPDQDDDQRAEERRKYKRDWERKKHANETDIQSISAVAHPVRRAICSMSLHMFLTCYFPESTGMTPFSDDHVEIIDRLENCLNSGGRIINAVYRGFAKTTMTENAALWATLTGRRRFVAVYSADKGAADNMIDSMTKELSENDLLLADFPEICELFSALDGKAQRCRAQTFNGKPTHIRMSASQIVFPTITLTREDGSEYIPPACGAIIRAKGLKSASRGMNYKRPDGGKARPDFALIDDFQTDASARSLTEIDARLKVIKKGILKSAGHRKTIACAVNSTVIEADDAVDQLLDPEKHPAWEGMRIKMISQWADAHDTLWEEYRKIRYTFDRRDKADKKRAEAEANAFYRKNRAAMDAGCIVSWKSCYDPDTELSAIQHAYNMYFDDGPEVFASECQNDPVRAVSEGVEIRPAAEIPYHVNGYKRGEIPNDCVHVTAMIDVHDDLLYWMVCSFTNDFTGYVVDYGTYPDQPGSYFMKSQANKTMGRAHPGIGKEAAVVAGLERTVNLLCDREWTRTDGSPIRIGKLHIDMGWKPDQVELVCRRSKYAAILEPQRGIAINPGDNPIAEMDKKRCHRLGDNWYEPKLSKRSVRYVRADTNYWKVFFHNRLMVAVGDAGSLTLFTPTKRERDHRLIADHWTAEVPTLVTGKGREVVTWKCPPNKDNHWFDCAIGCMVAASMLGVSVEGGKPVEERRRGPKPMVKISDYRKGNAA